jgi:hypothetical protein
MTDRVRVRVLLWGNKGLGDKELDMKGKVDRGTRRCLIQVGKKDCDVM